MMSKRKCNNTSIKTYSSKKIKIEPNTDDCTPNIRIKSEDTKIKEEKDSRSYTLFPNPIVVTKKLEDMCIMQENIHSIKPDNLLKLIYNESKPEYFKKRDCNCSFKRHKIDLSKLEYKLTALSIQKDKNISSYHDTHKKTEHIILNSDDESLLIAKRSEDIKIDYKTISNVTQSNKKTNSEDIIELSSDEEITLTTSTQNLKKAHKNFKTYNTNIKTIDNLKKSRNINDNADKINLAKNYDSLVHNMKMIADLKVLSDLDEKNSNTVIVINNLYLNQMDIYTTNKTGHVLEFETIFVQNYYLLNKMFSTDIYKQLLWIDCCCWTKRQKEIEKKLSKEFILKYVSTPHSCWTKCSCCCNYIKTNINSSNESVPDLDLLLKSKVNSILSTKFSNNLIETALNYKKPIQQRMNERLDMNTNYEQKSYNPISLQFEFVNVRHQKQFTKNVKLNLATSNESENNFKLLLQLGRKREIMFHCLIKNALIDHTPCHNKQENIYKQKICCKFYFENILKRLSSQYFAHSESYNYVQQMLKTKIYELALRGCIARCNNKNQFHTSANTGTQLKCHRVISMNREHSRKFIKGQLIQRKTIELGQTLIDVNLQTMQEMIKNVEEKFQNANFYINDKGLAVVTLPLPYNFYPIEDLKILNKVLEFTQNKIAHLQLPAGTAITLHNKVHFIIERESEYSNNNIQNVNSLPTPHNDNNFSTQSTNDKNKLFNSCSMLIKCNTLSYCKSFTSFVTRSSSSKEKCDLLPKISSVCSLSDNFLMGSKLQNALETKTQTLVIDSESNSESN